jgi:2-oxoglutarate ferredoxin oxidoreductase subunit alpha
MNPKTMNRGQVEQLDRVVILFAGDSGDGMQVTGSRFSSTAALLGNDIATFPDFPAEIRAPAGTLPGVSGFQINFSSHDIYTPGDRPDVLVAMNPAALRAKLGDLKPGGIIVLNVDSFTARNLEKAHYESNPLEDHSLDGYRVYSINLTKLTREALKDTGLNQRVVDRCKNFYALGLMYWLYHRPLEPTLEWLDRKFKAKPEIAEANKVALKAGYTTGEATEIFQTTYEVEAAPLAPGRYRNISGNAALSLGLLAVTERAGLRLFFGSYPITPASTMLHELARYKEFGVITFQAEDEIAAVSASIGASFAGMLGACATSGPGLALKTEALGLAVMTELPLVVCDIQRGGPSTGLPTKTEQADLGQAMWGRNSEAPLPVVAASTPSDCFDTAIEAARIAIQYMTPVILLSDGYIANGAEPWLLPDLESLPRVDPGFRRDPEGFLPYDRDRGTLARPWAIPGTPGLEHRIGGLEKEDRTGNVSYDPENHERMVGLRAEKVARVAETIPPLEVQGPGEGKILVLGWGSTYGAIRQAVEDLDEEGFAVGHVHLRHLNPFPRNLGEVMEKFETILIPEMNSGHLRTMVQAKFLRETVPLNKIQGRPFLKSEIYDKIKSLLGVE